MKFAIDSKAFQSVTERAAVCAVKANNCLPIFNCVCIRAEQSPDRLTVVAGDGNTFAELSYTEQSPNGVFFSVQEPGVAFVGMEDLKRLYQAKGELTVLATDTLHGSKFSVASDKKKCEVKSYRFDTVLEYPAPSGEEILRADQKELTETFRRLSCCLQTDQGYHYDIYRGFNLDGANKRIVSLDGGRLGLRSVDWFNDHFLSSAVVSGNACAKLSSIIGKQDGETVLLTDGKYGFFVGADYTVATKLIPGKFMDIDFILKTNYPMYVIEVKLSDLCAPAKEYHSITKKSPMSFFWKNGRLSTVMKTDSYSTLDFIPLLDVSGDYQPDGYIASFNSRNIKELKEIFPDGIISIAMPENQPPHKTNFIVANEDGYLCLILPVKVQPEILEGITEFAQSA